MSAISRRAALRIAAGVLAAAAGTAAVGSRACAGARPPRRRADADAPVEYVDRDGWMMTPAEGEKLPAPARTGS